MTERFLRDSLRMAKKRGETISLQVKALVELDAQATVDVSALLSAVIVFVQGYGTAVLTGLAWLMRDAAFSSSSLALQEATVEQVVLWRSLTSTAGTIAFERRLTNFDQLIDALPSGQFVSANERGLLLGNALDTVLSDGADAGIAFSTFWNLTVETKAALGRLAALDLVLESSPDFDPARELTTLLTTGVPLLPAVSLLVSRLTAPAAATKKRLPRALSVLVGQGDTIESLAAATLGSAARWPVLVEFNELRYPYIASDPTLFLGEYLGEKVLAAPTVQGQKTLTLLDVDGLQLNQRVRLAWNGVEQIVTIQALTGETGAVHIVEALNAVFPTIATVQVYGATSETFGRILKVGDTLLIPTNEISAGSPLLDVQPAIPAATRLYGTDIAIADDGSLSVFNGDLKTVAGVANLQQAVRRRFTVERGSLVYHPLYGTGLHRYLGHKNTSYFGFLAQVDAHQTLARDPRIAEITDFSGVIQGDQLLLTVGIKSTAEESFPPIDIRIPLA